MRTALCLLGIATISVAQASPDLSQLGARLGQANTIHARFSQTKVIQALKKPLRTSGRVVFAQGKGVLWLIEKPYQASYALTTETVAEISPNGTRKERNARDVPALAHVGRVFQSIFQGDLHAMEEHFDVTVSGEPEHWRVGMKPKQALSRFLSNISVQGGLFLERIEIEEAQGDHTRIDFRDSQLDAPLVESEVRLFKP